MSDIQRLEEDVRRALRATADALAVEDRDYDAGGVEMVGQSGPIPIKRRQRSLLVATVVVVVVVVVLVGAALIVRQTGGSNHALEVTDTSTTAGATTTTSGRSTPTGPSSQPAPAALVAEVASVPVAVLDAVGAGTAAGLPVPLPGPALTKDNKPRIVWIGAEWCPYCAAQRWPLILALSRFGTFSDLRETSSAATDVLPNTQTFSFHGSTYSSPYVALDAVETATNEPPTSPSTAACGGPLPCATSPGNGYAPLDTPTPDEQTLIQKFDAPPYVSAGGGGTIPFLDFANRYLISGAMYDPGVLHSTSPTGQPQAQTADDIANALSDPTSEIAKGIDGTANIITAVICKLTNDQPATVCSDPTITGIQQRF